MVRVRGRPFFVLNELERQLPELLQAHIAPTNPWPEIGRCISDAMTAAGVIDRLQIADEIEFMIRT